MQSKHVKNRQNKMKKGKGNVAEAINPNTENETTLVVVHNANEETATAETSENFIQPTEAREGKTKTVKEIIEKNFRVSRTVEKLEQLNQTSKTLDSFNFGSSKVKDTLEISDGKGNSFETSNLYLIDKVVTLLKSEIENKSVEFENELQLLEAA